MLEEIVFLTGRQGFEYQLHDPFQEYFHSRLYINHTSPERLFDDNTTDGMRRYGDHVGPDGRPVKCDIVKFLLPLHLHVVVSTKKVNAKCSSFHFYL